MAIAATALAGVAWSAVPAPAASAATICTWGGTPAAPTGTVTITPGVTNTPASGPLRLRATGELGGGCAGTMTFTGQVDAGSSCAVIQFEGTVKGLPGVDRFWGPGLFGLVNELLYDKTGNIVGADQPQVLTRDNQPHLTDCATPEGFHGGTFSSTVELYR
ncbi:MAG TPA: hypothetical protein VGO28_09520 [Acidimicrobiia bacterium]